MLDSEADPGDPMILQCFVIIWGLVRDRSRECVSGKVIANGLVQFGVSHLMVRVKSR